MSKKRKLVWYCVGQMKELAHFKRSRGNKTAVMSRTYSLEWDGARKPWTWKTKKQAKEYSKLYSVVNPEFRES